jgi:hypothetical protein
MFNVDEDIIVSESIEDKAKALELISFQVAELLRIKEALEKQVADLLHHADEGQKTYIVGRYKILCKSGFNYSLNKDEYESIGKRLPACFDPVNKVLKYELNKKIIREAYLYGSTQDKEILDAIITAKPAKLSVTVSPGV